MVALHLGELELALIKLHVGQLQNVVIKTLAIVAFYIITN